MWACQKGHVEVIKILLAHGADTQIEDNKGKKAINFARSQEIKDLLQG
jgi:ankyrin repeat protein